ncbi:acetylornithine transaminase [Peribacillus sp. SCS-155]|uniref:acetylornithine transaminase n=1 Tax=Peribacillus sedimenti TaxID=3115297 RepID=UPI003905895A
MNSLFPTYLRWNIEPEHAKGSWLTSTEGKEYLDFTSGIGVTNLGHCNDQVTEAIQTQLGKFWHTSNMFLIGVQQKAADLLAEAAGLDCVFFSNSGAEANEAAIKLARKATTRNKIVTFHNSFHGRTFATMAATGQDKIKTGYGPMLPTFEYVSFNDSAELLKAVDEDTAAVMLEIVQGEGGIHVAQQEFLNTITEACRAKGALIIVDEVQTGIGRTGKPFAYQHFDFKPDIITSAKGLGNGLPIGAMIGKKELAEYFGPGSHGSTFGGNPLCASAAVAVLQTIMQPGFMEEAAKKGEYLQNALKKVMEDTKMVKDLRTFGLMAGIELNVEAQQALLDLQEQGLLVLTAGPNVLRLLPPLTVEYAEIDTAVEKISKILSESLTVS